MQTGPGLSLRGRAERRRSKPWAAVLFVGYFLLLVAELSMIRLQRGTDGRLTAFTAEEPGEWVSLLVLIVTIVSFLCAVGFISALYRERQHTSWWFRRQGVTGTDVVYVIAWLQAFNTCQLLSYGLFVTDTIFVEGTVGSLLETASFQLCILAVVPLWFRGRMGEIGVCRPVQLRWMFLALLLLFLFVVFALDVLVTNPIADWLHLSPESERERQIEEEIVRAREHNLPGVIASLFVIAGLVPIAEEILFRGVIQTYLVQRWGAFAGIVASSLWFALVHIDIALFAPLFAIGLALGYLRHRFQSLWGAVLLHAMNNLAGVLYHFA
jgi:membrane protease YdiL (CAAX protease family)